VTEPGESPEQGDHFQNVDLRLVESMDDFDYGAKQGRKQ